MTCACNAARVGPPVGWAVKQPLSICPSVHLERGEELKARGVMQTTTQKLVIVRKNSP
jgi:hypothetical protein